MPKNIEMSVMGSSGSYEVLYPKSVSDIILSSNYLNGVFNLSANSDIDDVFDYINRKIILLQYDKAGINVTLKSAGGSPLEGIPINGITANYDGTGSCVTDSEGKCFGYCDAGNVTVSTNKYVDMTVSSQQLNVLASEMYNTELTASNFVNFKKWTSSVNNIRFSNNVSRVDVSVGGGGGGGGYGYTGHSTNTSCGGGGGGGGYVNTQESVNFSKDVKYSVVIGSGGSGGSSNNDSGNDGGQSSFLDVIGDSGKGGPTGDRNGSVSGGIGNGNGGQGIRRGSTGWTAGGNGEDGYQSIFSSFTETTLYGGGGCGGGSGSYVSNFDLDNIGGNPGGGNPTTKDNDGEDGKKGTGGGGAGGSMAYSDDRQHTTQTGNGGSGCVAIRIHLKVTA